MSHFRLVIAGVFGIGMAGGLATFYWFENDSGSSAYHAAASMEQEQAVSDVGQSVPTTGMPSGVSAQPPRTSADENPPLTKAEGNRQKPTRDDVKKLLVEVDDMVRQFSVIPRCEAFGASLQAFYNNASMSLLWADEQLAAQYRVSRQQGDLMLPVYADYYAKAYGSLSESIESAQMKTKLEACQTGKSLAPG